MSKPKSWDKVTEELRKEREEKYKAFRKEKVEAFRKKIYGYGINYGMDAYNYGRYVHEAQPETLYSSIAGAHIEPGTGRKVEDDGKVLDANGWRKAE